MPHDSDEAWLKASVTRKRCPPGGDGPQAHSSTCPEAEQQVHVNNLPPAILHGIFGHLGPRDLCVVSATCQHWRALNQDKASREQWKQFYTSRWRVMGPNGEDVCWQTKYGSKMKQGKSWAGKYESDNLWGHKAGVKALKLLPSHGVLLTGSLDRTVRLWDLTYGMPLSISQPHGGTVRAVALDHTLVASGSSDNVVRLWHARHATDGSNLLDPAEAAAAAAAATAARTSSSSHDPLLGLAERLMELDGPTDPFDDTPLHHLLPHHHGSNGSNGGGLTAAAVAAVDASSSSGCIRTGGGRGGGGGRGPYSVVTGEADEGLFDLSLPGQALRGHIGPVTSLCLTDSALYSGSWDYSVRVWRRGSWDCVSVLKYPDWVYSVVARGGLLLVASGPEVHVHDLPTGKLVRKFQNLHEGSVSCLEGTHSGRLLFSGGADGLLMVHDLRMKEASRVLWHHNAGVNSLALEDPWLVSAASDGTVIMHNLEAALPNNFSGCVSSSSSGPTTSSSSSSAVSKRTLGCPGQSGPMYCVDIAESWLAAGGETPAVRTWDFTRAAEAAARAAAARAARGSSKRAAKVRKAAAAAAGGGGGPGSAGAAGGSSSSMREAQPGRKGQKGRTVGGISSAVAAAPAAAATGSGGVAAAALAAAGSSSSGSRRPKGLLAAAAAAAAAAGSGNLSTTPPGGSSSGLGSSSRADRFHKLQSKRGGSRHARHHDNSSSSSTITATTATAASPVQACGSGGDAVPAAAGGSSSKPQDSMLAAAAAAAAGQPGAAAHAAAAAKRGTDSSHCQSSGSGGKYSYGSSPQMMRHWHGPCGSKGGGGGSSSAPLGTSPGQQWGWLGGSSPPVASRLHHSSSNGGRRHSSSGGNHHAPAAGAAAQPGGGYGGGGSGSGGGGSSRRGIPIPAAAGQNHNHRHYRRTGGNADPAAVGGVGAAASSYDTEGGAFMAGMSPGAFAVDGSAGCGISPQGTPAAAGVHMRGGSRAAAPAADAYCSAAAAHGNCWPAVDGSRSAAAAAACYRVPFSSSYPSAGAGPGPWLLSGSSPRYEVWGTTLHVAAASSGDRRLAIVRPVRAGEREEGGGGARGGSGSGCAGGDSPRDGVSGGIVAGSISN